MTNRDAFGNGRDGDSFEHEAYEGERVDEVDERFADWVDGRLSDEAIEELEREVAGDPALRERADAYRELVATLQDHLRVEEQPPVGFAASVLSELPGARRGKLIPFLASLTAAAAMVMIFFVLEDFTSRPTVTESAVGDAPASSISDARNELEAPQEESDRGQDAARRPELARVAKNKPDFTPAPDPSAQSDSLRSQNLKKESAAKANKKVKSEPGAVAETVTKQPARKPARSPGAKPAQQRPAQQRPAQQRPAQQRPVQQKPTEKKTAEKPATAEKSPDKTAGKADAKTGGEGAFRQPEEDIRQEADRPNRPSVSQDARTRAGNRPADGRGSAEVRQLRAQRGDVGAEVLRLANKYLREVGSPREHEENQGDRGRPASKDLDDRKETKSGAPERSRSRGRGGRRAGPAGGRSAGGGGGRGGARGGRGGGRTGFSSRGTPATPVLLLTLSPPPGRSMEDYKRGRAARPETRSPAAPVTGGANPPDTEKKEEREKAGNTATATPPAKRAGSDKSAKDDEDRGSARPDPKKTELAKGKSPPAPATGSNRSNKDASKNDASKKDTSKKDTSKKDTSKKDNDEKAKTGGVPASEEKLKAKSRARRRAATPRTDGKAPDPSNTLQAARPTPPREPGSSLVAFLRDRETLATSNVASAEAVVVIPDVIRDLQKVVGTDPDEYRYEPGDEVYEVRGDRQQLQVFFVGLRDYLAVRSGRAERGAVTSGYFNSKVSVPVTVKKVNPARERVLFRSARRFPRQVSPNRGTSATDSTRAMRFYLVLRGSR